jgi:hypothetical protein
MAANVLNASANWRKKMKKYGSSKVAKFAKILQGWQLTFNAIAKQFLLPFLVISS